MKFYKECFLAFVCMMGLGCGVMLFVRYKMNNVLVESVKSSEPFFLEGKQHHCGLTPEQVDVDLKQDELNRAMEKRHVTRN